MTDKSIEARIREHYVSENGEWLVERGTLKAKLAKATQALVEAMIVPEAWMISGFPRMSQEAEDQIKASVRKARAALAEINGESHE